MEKIIIKGIYVNSGDYSKESEFPSGREVRECYERLNEYFKETEGLRIIKEPLRDENERNALGFFDYVIYVKEGPFYIANILKRNSENSKNIVKVAGNSIDEEAIGKYIKNLKKRTQPRSKPFWRNYVSSSAYIEKLTGVKLEIILRDLINS